MKKTTIKDVAKLSGVSIATVSRAINKSGYVSTEIKRRIDFAVKQLNYRPNLIARSLKKEQIKIIGIIVPDISNPYFMRISNI